MADDGIDMRDDLGQLDRRITDAMTVLRGARAMAAHSPDVQTLRLEAMAERTLNELLDRRPRLRLEDRAGVLSG